MITKQKKRVIGLIVVSHKRQAFGGRGGIARQRMVIKRTVAKLGYKCLKIVEVVRPSGGDLINQPKIQKILKQLTDTKIHGLIAVHLDCLFRPMKLRDDELWNGFMETKAIVYTEFERFNFGSAEGQWLAYLSLALSGFDRQLAQKRASGAKPSIPGSKCKMTPNRQKKVHVPKSKAITAKKGLTG